MAGIARTVLAAGSALIATLAFAGSAQAGCGTCVGHTTSTSTLPPLSSYFEHEAKQASCQGSTYCRQDTQTVVHPPVKHKTKKYKAKTVTKIRTAAPLSFAPAPPAYTPLTPSTIQGLGHGEGLRPTSCPVSVDVSNGGRVLGCYNVVRKVVRPVTRTTYYQVVRPIIYVRYPVAVPTCAVPTCRTHYHHHHHHGGSRYGY